jgi:glycosyltransferase involved in cell wall biosynthesis
VSVRTLNLDISDLYRARGRTGIQRVVREIGARLVGAEHAGYRVRILRFDVVEHHFLIVDLPSALHFLRGESDDLETEAIFQFADFGPADIFLDIDAVWSSALKRPALYSRLKAQGVMIVTIVHDLIPLEMPQYVHPATLRNWTLYISAVYAYTDLVFLVSRSAEKDFLRFKAELGEDRYIPTIVVGNGADFSVSGEPSADELAAVSRFALGEYLLFVGTIEPRKLHRSAIRAMELIHETRPNTHLVLAGRQGWNTEDTVAELVGHRLYGSRIHWVNGPSDAMLDRLYANATATLYLSNGEGYGLPVAESLARGRVTIASGNTAIFEVGENFTDYVSSGTAGEIAETALVYLSDPALRSAREKQIREGFVPQTWDSVVTAISEIFSGLDRAATIAAMPIPIAVQWVFISNVPSSLARTIALMDDRVDWVSEVVVIAPEALETEIRGIPTRLPIRFIGEEGVLGERMTEFRAADHQRKNWMLRSSLATLDGIDDEFIMLDDDNQPGRVVEQDVFLGRDPRYRAYYYFEMALWPHHLSEYDAGQHATRESLRAAGLEALSYSSHQPQVINKALFREAVTLAETVSPGGNTDEWSFYFNYVSARYPTLIEKRIYRTLGWPSASSKWRAKFAPEEFLFENYYPELYETGELAGITPASPLDDKVARRTELDAPYQRSDELYAEGALIAGRYDMVHGAMEWKRGGNYLVVAGVPHVITVGVGAPARVHLRYTRIATLETQFCYRVIGGDMSYGMVVGPPHEFAESPDVGILEIDFPGQPLAAGTWDIEFFAIIGGEPVFTPGVILRSRLVVIADGATVVEALARM